MYDYDLYTSQSMFSGSVVWTVIAGIIAVVGGILAYFLFVKKDEKVNNKFLAWMKEFLSFRKLLLENILKVTYIILAIFVTLTSFNMISISFVGFLLYLVLGNVLLRVIYESALMLIMICRNTTEINKKMK